MLCAGVATFFCSHVLPLHLPYSRWDIRRWDARRDDENASLPSRTATSLRQTPLSPEVPRTSHDHYFLSPSLSRVLHAHQLLGTKKLVTSVTPGGCHAFSKPSCPSIIALSPNGVQCYSRSRACLRVYVDHSDGEAGRAETLTDTGQWPRYSQVR